MPRLRCNYTTFSSQFGGEMSKRKSSSPCRGHSGIYCVVADVAGHVVETLAKWVVWFLSSAVSFSLNFLQLLSFVCSPFHLFKSLHTNHFALIQLSFSKCQTHLLSRSSMIRAQRSEQRIQILKKSRVLTMAALKRSQTKKQIPIPLPLPGTCTDLRYKPSGKAPTRPLTDFIL